MEVICEEGADFIITSLGSPEETINKAHKHNIKVFCDVTDLSFAKKVENLGADAIIAVNNEAGGHRGNFSPKELITQLVENCSIPVISAGGVGCRADLDKMLSFGAVGVSVGSPFIASTEANVTEEYKQACINNDANDIVLTERISGSPCTVINTPYVQKIGVKQPWIDFRTKLRELPVTYKRGEADEYPAHMVKFPEEPTVGGYAEAPAEDGVGIG